MTTTRIAGRLLLITGVLAMLAVTIALGGSQAKQDLAKAIDYYKAANYDRAIELLTDLAKEKTLEKTDLREIWLVLGRSYLAKSMNDKATDAISHMLDLEPPMVELDPDAECPPLMKIYYNVRKAKNGNTQVERKDPGMQTIAVLDFLNRSIDDKERFDPMQKGFADLVINNLNGAVNLKVVERERIQWLLEEINMENNPEKFDQATAVRMGKLLGVHAILLGNFIKAGNKLYLGARLVKVETGEILMGEQKEGDADEFYDLAKELSTAVAEKINVTLTGTSRAEAPPAETKSLDAIMSYSDGLVFLEKGDYKMAYDKFMEALDRDPSFEKARARAESLRPVLG